jgi:O-antigen/teichoic acid export membrane protein
MRLTESNVFWSGLEAAISAVLSFVSAFIVARLVGPQEVGIGASVVAIHVLLWVVVNALFADALVQRAVVSEEDASSGLWASSLVGMLAGAVQAFAGLGIAASMSDQRIVVMSLVLALPLPVVGAGGAMQGLLTRNRQYKVLAGRALIGQGLGTLTGVACAAAGLGAWALVMQQFVTSLVGALSLLLRSRWRPRRTFRWRPVRELLDIGLPLVMSTLVLHSRYRLFALLIGGTAGAAALGQVHMAFRLVDTVRDLLCSAMWRLSLPTMSECQADLPALRAAIARFLDLSALVLFPTMGAMLVCIQPLVRLLLGPVWQGSADGAGLLILLSIYVFMYFPAGVALVARGITRLTLLSNLAMTVLTLAGVVILRPANPLQAVEVWLGAQVLVSPVVQVLTARALGDSVLAQMRAGLPALALTGGATAAAFLVPRVLGEPHEPAALMAARLSVGALVYLPAALILLRGSVGEALQTIGLRRRPA